MRKLLLLSLMLTALIAGAQDKPNFGKCEALFTYKVNNEIMSILPGTAINFYDQSAGNVQYWFWDFGDGNTSTEQNPMFFFNHPMPGDNVKINPYKTVTLTVLTTDSCKSLYSQTINIMGDTTTYQPPACKADFWYYQVHFDSINKTATMQLTNNSVGDGLEYLWQFDNGQTSSDREPKMTFDLSQRARKVCLSVKGKDGCSDQSCLPVYLYNLDVPVDTVKLPPLCETAFGYSVNHDIKTFAPALVLDFYSKANPEATEWQWDFGDGTTSTEANPTHIFNLPLTKETDNADWNPLRKVCLTVKTAGDCVANHCESIYLYMDTTPVDTTVVSPDCETAFGYSVNYDVKTFAPALVLDFYSKASPEATEWNWDFGDGTTSTEANPTHIFNLPVSRDGIITGQYPYNKVCLTVKTAGDCVANYCQTIDLYMKTIPVDTVQQCHAWLKYYQVSDVVSIPEVVVYRLVDVSEGKVVSRLWQFEDGTTSTEAEPQVSFSIFKPTQKVGLTIQTADNCSSTWYETIYVSGTVPPDSGFIDKPVNVYRMKYESSFPIYMSSCAGWAKAQVYRNDSLVKASNYWWSTGAEGQEVKGLCPTQTYTVKALAPDGTYVSGTFLFNSDGTVTDAPFNWWVIGKGDDPLIQCDPANKDYTVEWRLCDGTMVKSDSINLGMINCGGNESNMMVKDASGTVVYSELISTKSLTTGFRPVIGESSVKLYPNPVSDVLNIQYSGKALNEMQLEIWDMAGRRVSMQKFYDVESGQQLSVNVNALYKGLYLCKMLSGQQVIRIEKFTK